MSSGLIVCVFSDVVRFDNTYSWTRSKKVYYQIEVLEVGSGDSTPDAASNDEFVTAPEHAASS